MNIEQEVGFRTEYQIDVVSIDGTIKQSEKFGNMILNNFYTRICNFQAYFVNINFGTGTGTKAATRTSLFTYLGTKAAVDVELKKDVANNSIYWKRKIQLMPEEFVGSNITEVGIAYDTGTSSLVTHAEIQDSVGNQISIAKTDTDIINIYATVYVVLGNNYSNVAWTTSNQLVDYLVGNTTFPTMYFHFGKIGTYNSTPTNPLVCELKLGSSVAIAQANWTKDATNKKITTPTTRIDINTSNGAIREIGFGSTDSSGILRMCLPITGVYTSDSTTNEPLGAGDGVTATWKIANPDATSVQLKVDSTVVTGTSSNINLSPNVKLRNPSDLPSGQGNGCSFSSDGNYLAVAHSIGNALTIYKKNNDVFVKLNNIDVFPTTAGLSCSFSQDTNYLAVTQNASPYITIYKRINDTFTKLSNPDILPTNTGNGCSWSPDGVYLAVVHAISPYITIYKRSGDSFTKLTNPSTLPTSDGKSCSWSNDGIYLAIAHANSPYVTIYKRSVDTFSKLSNPDVLPPSTGTSVAFSYDNNYLAVTNAANATPHITIYKRNVDTFTKLANPDVLPAGNCYGCAFSCDGNYLVTVQDGTPRVIIYKRNNDIFTQISNPDVLFTGQGNGCSFSSDGTYLAVANSASPYVSIYKRTGQQTLVTFDTPPAVGTTAKASYTVDYIPKDTNRVIDLAFTIQFGEVV